MKFISAIALLGFAAQVTVAGRCPAYSAAPVSSAPAYSSAAETSAPAPATSDVVPTSASLPAYSSAAQSSAATTSTYASVPASTTVNGYSTAAPSSVPSGVFQVKAADLDRAVSARAGDGNCSARPDECAPNTRALAAINKALKKYNITRRGEVVAVLSLMAFESGDWAFNINHYPEPGRPGQGTRNMMMYNFVEEYAKYLHPTEANALLGSGGTPSDSTKNAVRQLVLNDDDSFGAGFWYLTQKAGSFHDNPAKLIDGNEDSFKDYIVNGVGTGYADERKQYWDRFNSNITA
ncbi:hypothetical protein FBU59_003233 [Linderina macrospora]|uniref:Uncharacterized protein n=1 Tax=Linderina macrospora TaxID=4868 RepID=A0ACC1J8W5_9FUNG|nr:hypothetical protein FBU59_003233 [Linderina macrospora]